MSERDRDRRDGGASSGGHGAAPLAVNQGVFGMLVERLGPIGAARVIQRRLAARATQADKESAPHVQAAADQGTSGGSSALPHLETIQRSFGKHDVSGIKAHVDGAAAEGAAKMGAEAYATGDHVAFAGAPTLHTAAHEAAHVVQQRGGVHLKGGVGEEGDDWERHADAVADRVVSGRSAEALLDRHAPSTGGAAAVQRKIVDVEGQPLASGKMDALLKRFRASAHHVRLHRVEGFTIEAIDLALDDIAGEKSAELRVPLGEGSSGDPILEQLADRVRAFLTPRYVQYQGTHDATAIKNFPRNSKNNLIVGHHFYSAATGDELMRGLSAGNASVLDQVDVALPNWKVDSIEWGIFQFVGEPRFFLVRSAEGEVSLNGKWAPEAGVHCIAHSHPAHPGDAIKSAVAPAAMEREVSGGLTNSKFQDPKFEPLKQADDKSGIPLVLALDAIVASKILGPEKNNDMFHLFPSDADFSSQRPGELVYTPYRYDRASGLLYNFDRKTLPTLVWETIDKEHFKGEKTKQHDPWVKVTLRLYASDQPNVNVWSRVCYSRRFVYGKQSVNQTVFDPALCS